MTAVAAATDLTSVWEGNDGDFLSRATPFYLRRALRTPILDATWGKGVFWAGQALRPCVVGVDNNPEKRAEVLADNRVLPFRNEAFDVVVYDPPHIVHPWSDWDSDDRYSVAEGRGSIAYLFPPFLIEAERVLTAGGILIAKLADQVHSGRSWFQMGEYVTMLPFAGFTACDIVVKVRGHARPQPAGRRVLHAARRHSYYVIARKGKGC